MRITRDAINGDSRLAGELHRYHDHPTVQTSTVASHTWHVMRLWWELFGPMSADVSTSILWHDGGEHGAGPGDVPFGAKRRHPQLAEVVDLAERDGLEAIGVLEEVSLAWSRLSEQERRRVKICDLLEMHEFGVHELLRGCHYGAPIVDDTMVAVRALCEGDIETANKVHVWLEVLHRRYGDRT